MSGDNDNPVPPQPPDLTEIRKQLFTRGYKILPNRGKAPVIKRWSDPDYLARELTDSSKRTVPEKIERWSRRFPDALSTGVCLWTKLRVIDIDISDVDMVEALLDAIREFAPDIANRAPMRFGAVPKVALFVRAPDHEEPIKLFNPAGDLIYVGKTTFNLIRSHSYRRTGEAEDAPTHAVEIFGGEPTKAGKCSRQFGVYGPHSYNDDGTVAREYAWAADRPVLHEIDLADLPTLSCEVAYKIIDAFEALTKDVGWVRVEPPKERGDSDLIYDIDETTRFDLNNGTQISYEELCELFVPDNHLRCSSSFIKGNTGSNRSKCHVFWSPRHDCVAVYNYETAAKHYPARMATVEDWSHTALSEGLRQLRDEAEQEANPAAFSLPKAAELVAEHADPVDLWARFDPPSLPHGLLPRVIEDFAVDRSTTMGCDMSGIAVGALAVCAGAIPDNIKLQPKRNDTEWLESARLWVLQIGDPSTMKTPSISAATKPLRRIDSEMAREYQKAMDAWFRLSKDEQRHTPKPKKLRAMIFDTTIESTQEILRDSPNGVLLEDDELSGWFDAMYKYSGARGAQKDRSFWLQAYNGGSKTVDRITRGSVHIDNLSVSIIGGSQPGPIRKLADAGEDDGLLQRFLPIMVRPAVGGRDEAPGQAVLDYAKVVGGLLKLAPATELLADIMRANTPLKFDEGALKIREELEQKHLELMLLEGLNRKLTSHFGKYNGIFARLCLVWHCVERAAGGVGELPALVIESTARRVADFLHGFLKPHAVAFYVGVLGLSNDHDRLANVADFILAHKLERITNRDVARGDRSMRGLKKHETEAIFEQLEALGWIIRTPGTRPSDPPHWMVNPVVHQRFAERGEAARKRREQDREMIGELLKNDHKA